MDNIAPPMVCVFFGGLQQKFGPRKVSQRISFIDSSSDSKKFTKQINLMREDQIWEMARFN